MPLSALDPPRTLPRGQEAGLERVLLGLGQVCPVFLAVPQLPRAKRIVDRGVGVGAAGLDERDLPPGVDKPPGDDAAGGPRADDDVVELPARRGAVAGRHAVLPAPPAVS